MNDTISDEQRIRRLRRRIRTLTGEPDQTYYSPIPHMPDVRASAADLFGQDPGALPGIDLNEAGQLALLEALAAYYPDLPFSKEASAGQYGLDNAFFANADGIMLYAMLRHLAPGRVIEVGSGFSTLCMVNTIDAFLPVPPSVSCIEPDATRLRTWLGAEWPAYLSLRESTLQDVPLSLFDELGDGDILFVDSSHVMKIGSDVNRILFEVLPRLAVGVWVHVHDVFWPFEYPQNWVEDGRYWNEAYALRSFLSFNDAFQICLFNDFLLQRHRDWLEQYMPLAAEVTERPMTQPGSLWLRRVA